MDHVRLFSANIRRAIEMLSDSAVMRTDDMRMVLLALEKEFDENFLQPHTRQHYEAQLQASTKPAENPLVWRCPQLPCTLNGRCMHLDGCFGYGAKAVVAEPNGNIALEDRRVFERLVEDAERVALDLNKLLPKAEEAMKFLRDKLR